MEVSETHITERSQGNEPKSRHWSSRKFIITATSLVVSSFALFFEFMDGGDFAQVVSIVVGAYTVSNAATYYSRHRAMPIGPQKPWNGPPD